MGGWRRGRSGRWVALAVALLAVVGLCGPAAAAEDDDNIGSGPGPDLPPDEEGGGEIGGPVEIDWTMPSRFGKDANRDGLTDYMTPSDFCSGPEAKSCTRRPKSDPQPIAPTNWRAELDACSSALGTGENPTFRWEVVRGQGTITGGPGCGGFDLVVPDEGVYRVRLTVTSSLGTGSLERDITVQDWMILSMGDSYGSGEGNPDIDMVRNAGGGKVADAKWQDRRCHRSADAGSAQAARWLENADPRTSVTFIHVACSGAEAVAGLLESYDGVETTWEAQLLPALSPQITQARQLVAGREIDAAYISIGGNDANFAKIVMSCIALAPCNPRYVDAEDRVHPDGGLVAGVCGSIGALSPIAGIVCAPVLSDVVAKFAEDTAENHFAQGLRGGAAEGDIANYALSKTYRRLANALHRQVLLSDGDPSLKIPPWHADRIFVSEYVDATQDDEGDYCPKGDPFKPFHDVRIPGLARDEYEWLDLEVERKLNEVIAWNANDRGWTLVDGIHAGFAKHGICADDTYMVGLLTETLWRQDNLTGAAHPNRKGHQVYRNRIMSRLLPSLYPGAGGESLDIHELDQVRDWIAGHAPRLPAQVPVADAGGPYGVAEGARVTATNGSFDDGAFTSAWASSNEAVAAVDPSTASTPNIIGVDDGQTTVTLAAIDALGNVGLDHADVSVANVPPAVFTRTTPVVLDEGGTLSEAARYTDPGTADTHTAVVDFGDGTVVPVPANNGAVPLTHTYADDGTYTVTVAVTDDDGGTASSSFPVTVRNVDPSLDELAVPMAPVEIGATIAATSTLADPGADAQTLTWSWGDGSSTAQELGAGDRGAVSAEHAYAATGLYAVTLTATDDDGGTVSRSFEHVVVYDGAGGSITGGGTIESPAGAVAADPEAAGPAQFHFTARYRARTPAPSGTMAFRVAAADLDVAASSYRWLIVGSNGTAMAQGEATVNGAGGYAFRLTVSDGDVSSRRDPDQLRLEVWRVADGALVYDNQPGAEVGTPPTSPVRGGQISVRSGG